MTEDFDSQDVDLDRPSGVKDVSASPTEKTSVIFDKSDYADLNNSNTDDPLDNFIDNGEDGTS